MKYKKKWEKYIKKSERELVKVKPRVILTFDSVEDMMKCLTGDKHA